MRRVACSLVVLLAGCAGGTSRVPGLPEVPPEATEPSIHDIHPGVLRNLMTAGELFVVPDEETRAAMEASETRVIHAMVSVCLDTDGMATLSLAVRTRYESFNHAVLAAVGTWRFRPYLRDGRAAEACSLATFRYDLASKATDPPLANPAVELPMGDLGTWAFPANSVRVPATPGVALAQVCRRLRRYEPPDVTFLQSSGDLATDRALLDEREVMYRKEDPGTGGTLCRVRSMLVHVPEPAEIRKKPALERDVPPEVLAKLRISGSLNVFPADRVKEEIRRNHARKLQVEVKLCVDRTGRTSDVEILGTTGYLAYDSDLINAVAAWRYRPLVIDGAPVRACTVIQFVYQQKG